ncbi:MAG: HPF/RaiA family ribosome-associated protein [Nitrospirae bacterium]|jgi:ribosome-associated translation inhibitor RaiA|nr:HPF/RaiA family ribosome-associated protein [Nitrospirota bacterium]
MDLKIDSRNVGMTPRWTQQIQERMVTVQNGVNNITHARVTLTKNAHHKKGKDNAEALIVLTVPPRHTLTARKEAETFEEAIRLVFQAVEAEIKKFREKLTNVDAPQDPELVEME